MTTTDQYAEIRAEAKAAATAQAWTEEPRPADELTRLRAVVDAHISQLGEINTWTEFTAETKAFTAAAQPTPPRRILHRIAADWRTGADLDLDDALRDLDDAVAIDWVHGLAGRDLRYVDPAGKPWLLAVTRPQPAAAEEEDRS